MHANLIVNQITNKKGTYFVCNYSLWNIELNSKIEVIFKRSWRARALLNIGKEGDFICSNLLISTSLFFYQTP